MPYEPEAYATSTRTMLLRSRAGCGMPRTIDATGTRSNRAIIWIRRRTAAEPSRNGDWKDTLRSRQSLRASRHASRSSHRVQCERTTCGLQWNTCSWPYEWFPRRRIVNNANGSLGNESLMNRIRNYRSGGVEAAISEVYKR